jgi:glutaminase
LNFAAIVHDIAVALHPHAGEQGHVATYIPALARVPADQFGIALHTVDGVEAGAGDCDVPFSIQSVSKVFSLTMGLQAVGDALWQRVGREPSGNPFNSLVQLESEHGKPRNPFINAGAIVVADVLLGLGRTSADLVAMLSDLCGEAVDIDEEVAASEAETGFRNRALANFMKSFGGIENDVTAVLELYFRQCAIRMNCRQLARAASYLCRDGAHPLSGPGGAARGPRSSASGSLAASTR